MIEIGMNNVTKNFGFSSVLKGVQLEVMTGDRMAIVGKNGSGKSTIFQLIAKKEIPDSGTVSIRQGAKVGILEQFPKLVPKNITTEEVLREAFSTAMQVEEKLFRAEEAMAIEKDPFQLQALLEEYELLQNQFAALDGYAIEENFQKIAEGFSLTQFLSRPFSVLSSGQKTLVMLAQVILLKPDILLLDEPTNHLDIKTLTWFEEFLASYPKTVVIISHDRYFLDRVCTKTVLLDRGKTTLYKGNYSFMQQEQEHQIELEFAAYKNQQKKIEAMQASVKRLREWAAQGDNESLFRKANEIERRLSKIEELEKPKSDQPKFTLSFSGERSGKELLKVQNLQLSFDGNPLFEEANLTIFEREKVCLLGENGTGKTSFLNCLFHDTAYSGTISLSPSAKIGYLPQEIVFCRESDSVLKAFTYEYPSTEKEARSILAKFSFYKDRVYQTVSSLSGGERILLKLAVMLQDKINFLILDEPTNHIDISLRELLEEAIQEYKGTLLLVSHDRYFINKCAGRIISVKDKKFISFYGNYQDYVHHNQQNKN